MNSTAQLEQPSKTPYKTPKLEHHQWIITTGISVPIGSLRLEFDPEFTL